METIKPVMERLSQEERELLTAYLIRHTIGSAFDAAFGQKSAPIPDGMTVGMAIAEQRAFVEKMRIEEEANRIKKEKAIAVRKSITDQLTQVLSIRLVDIKTEGPLGFSTAKRVTLFFEAENKGQKAIIGIKGDGLFMDRFGDKIGETAIKVEASFAPGKVIKFTAREYAGGFSTENMKLAGASASNTSFSFSPSVVLFEDGSKIESPSTEEQK
jgi:hypothetical protein